MLHKLRCCSQLKYTSNKKILNIRRNIYAYAYLYFSILNKIAIFSAIFYWFLKRGKIQKWKIWKSGKSHLIEGNKEKIRKSRTFPGHQEDLATMVYGLKRLYCTSQKLSKICLLLKIVFGNNFLMVSKKVEDIYDFS